MVKKTFFLGVLCSTLWLMSVSHVTAALTPEEVAILATEGSPESLRIARHYALSRNIPPGNVFLMKRGGVTREKWDSELRPSLRKWLETHPKVRCFVCVWDIPLRIEGFSKNSPQVKGRLEYFTRQRSSYVKNCALIIALLNGLGSDTSRQSVPELSPEISRKELSELLQKALSAAQERVKELPPEQQKNALKVFQQIMQKTAGANALVQLGTQRKKKDPTFQISAELDNQLVQINGVIRGILRGIQSLEMLRESIERDAEILRLIQETDGLLGAINWLDSQVQLTRQNESTASFDSELSAIFLEGHPLIRWIPNSLSFQVSSEPGERFNRPVMMVSRLEAPSVETVLKLIDTSIKVEKEGLEGTVYLDARWKYRTGKFTHGSYEKTDQSLHELFTRLKKNTSLNVVINDHEGLLKKEECTKAGALYCGWYSMGTYSDTFIWSPGAVGYHMASMEAGSLRSGQLWCPQMLSRGVVATCGPTYEPYLSAFPSPDEFFSLVLTGKYSMIECYYQTQPFLSWAMTYVGDPLYTPYRENPQLTLDQIPETLKKKGTPEISK